MLLNHRNHNVSLALHNAGLSRERMGLKKKTKNVPVIVIAKYNKSILTTIWHTTMTKIASFGMSFALSTLTLFSVSLLSQRKRKHLFIKGSIMNLEQWFSILVMQWLGFAVLQGMNWEWNPVLGQWQINFCTIKNRKKKKIQSACAKL